MMVFENRKGFIAGKAGKAYPAPVKRLKVDPEGASKGPRRRAEDRGRTVRKLAKTTVCDALIGLFLKRSAS